MINTCPLCGSVETTHRETISGSEINLLYARNFGVINALKSSHLDYCVCRHCELGFFSPLETGDADLYEHLQASDWYYMAEKEEFQIALRFMPSEGSVLEVGSGKAAFATLVGADRYTGLEFNDKAIESAKRAGITLHKETVEEHAQRCPRQYDVVVSFQVLEHVSSPSAFIKGCVDCLKTGGILILAVPSQDGFAGKAINNVLDMPPHHVTHWSEKTLRYISILFGLETIAVEHEPVPSYHRQFARKVQVETAIRKFFGLNFRLLDLGYSARLISKVAGVFARVSSQQQNGLKGHTAVAVYRKV